MVKALSRGKVHETRVESLQTINAQCAIVEENNQGIAKLSTARPKKWTYYPLIILISKLNEGWPNIAQWESVRNKLESEVAQCAVKETII